jgi:hypothetical protein
LSVKVLSTNSKTQKEGRGCTSLTNLFVAIVFSIWSRSLAFSICWPFSFVILNRFTKNIEGECAHAVNTAWAMLALIYAGQVWFVCYQNKLWAKHQIYESIILYLFEYQFNRDPTPLHRAAGDFPQQVGWHFVCVDNTTLSLQVTFYVGFWLIRNFDEAQF